MSRVPRILVPLLLFLALTAPRPTVAQPEPDDDKAPATKTQRLPADTTVAWTEVGPEYREGMKKRLSRVTMAVPRPPAPYQPAEGGGVEDVSLYTGLIKGTPRWAPIEAWWEREFQALPTSVEGGEYRSLEVQIALNGVRGLSLGLASKSDKPHLFDIPGALAIVQSTVGGVDTTQTDLAPEERMTLEPITLLRVYIVGANLEAQLRERFAKSGGYPGFGPTQLASNHPDMVRSIVAEFFGPKSDVEALARKIDVAGLRKLLDS